MNLPYQESQITDISYIRTFYENVDSGDFTWHRDREDRIIESIDFTDWMIQLENELPKSLNQKISIPMGVWHRVIKGTGDLKIKLIKIPK
jgi:hypothetical protein